jgi:hypothetical protein
MTSVVVTSVTVMAVHELKGVSGLTVIGSRRVSWAQATTPENAHAATAKSTPARSPSTVPATVTVSVYAMALCPMRPPPNTRTAETSRNVLVVNSQPATRS